MNSPATYDDVEPGPAPFTPPPPWSFLATLPAALHAPGDATAAFRQVLAEGSAQLRQRFADDEPVAGLMVRTVTQFSG